MGYDMFKDKKDIHDSAYGKRSVQDSAAYHTDDSADDHDRESAEGKTLWGKISKLLFSLAMFNAINKHY